LDLLCEKQYMCVCCHVLQEVFPSLRSLCQDGGCHLVVTAMQYSHVQDIVTVSNDRGMCDAVCSCTTKRPVWLARPSHHRGMV